MDGTPFGQYRLIELLGRGGMGEVWRAHDTVIDRIVALKILPPHFSQDTVFRQRFRREAHAAARLNNPHVIPIHTHGEIDGRLYVDMRLIEGRDLQAILADGPMSPARAVRIIEQVAEALNAAHKIGLVHRDVKPSNIVLDESEFAYLIDFGIARAAGETGLTGTRGVIGSWHYMAPERFGAGEVDQRSDVYALACVLAECLTGQHPYPGDSLEQQYAGHVVAPPPRPSHTGAPAEFDPVIATGMAKNPDERYATAMELASAARAAMTVPLLSPGPTRPAYPASRPGQLTASSLDGHGHFPTSWAAPVAQPSVGPMPDAKPAPTRPVWRRPRVVIPAVVAVVVLIGGGVLAAAQLSRHRQPTTSAAAAGPNTGPFTGTYAANYAPATDLDGKPYKDEMPATETWGVRSVCRSSGCVAVASRRSGGTTLVTALVFDDVGGRWLAVGVGAGKCFDAPAERWQVFTLQPHPDGTLAGQFSSTASNGCQSARTVTFTRIADVDVTGLPDPATQAPRVVSPAEALRGRYHETDTYAIGGGTESDFAVRTDCLRASDRCISYFHSPDAAYPLVYDSRRWIFHREVDGPCPRGGTSHVISNGEFPLPTPTQDPIAQLTGHGRQEETGSACTGTDFESKFVRIGD